MALARSADAPPESEAALDEYPSRPTAATTSALADLDGDVLILGAGGKLGLSLASMARRGLDEAGKANTHVTAVSRFGNASTLARFHEAALGTLACDLLADGALETLPDAANIVSGRHEIWQHQRSRAYLGHEHVPARAGCTTLQTVAYRCAVNWQRVSAG
jgi:hypothetical protein